MSECPVLCDVCHCHLTRVLCVVWRQSNIRLVCDIPLKDTTIDALDLSRSDLGKEGANAAMWYTSINAGLHQMDVRYNQIPKDAKKELQDICDLTGVVLTR